MFNVQTPKQEYCREQFKSQFSIPLSCFVKGHLSALTVTKKAMRIYVSKHSSFISVHKNREAHAPLKVSS